MKSVFGKATALAVASLLAGAVAVGCSAGNDAKQEESIGSVGMKLRVGPGINVPSVTATVTNTDTNTVAITRSVPTPGGGSDFNVAFSLPPGNYRIDLAAETAPGAPHPVECVGSATFTVVANVSNTITLTLTCDDVIQNGQQKFDVEVVSLVCPLEVDFASASPTSVRYTTGEVATLSGLAHDDLENTSTPAIEAPFSYLWTAPAGAGTFADATNPATTFTCATQNPNVILTLTATKPADADGLGCSDSLSVHVNCVSSLCGNGTTDSSAGETCDDGNSNNTDACPNDCNLFCGDGVIEGPEACEDPLNTDPFCESCQIVVGCGDGVINGMEECDDGNSTNTDACRNNCQLPECGDSIIDTALGETCDPPNGTTCDASCHTSVAGTCGDGTPGNAPGGTDVCDVVPAFSANCDSDCSGPITSPACLACETAGACAPAVDCAAFFTDAAQIRQCWEALDCFRDTACAVTSEFTCYCGTTPYDNCSAGTTPGNGVCKGLIEAGLGTTDVPTIFNNFANPAFPAGLAMARISCDKASCPAQCGF
jgi:cysteine-rich repeat protein